MKTPICVREEELLDALVRGYIGPELEAHLMSCDPCSELRLVAGALLDDRAQAMLEAPVPSSATMWWRMKARERREAEARARQSLWIGQTVTLAIAVALVISFFGHDVASTLRSIVHAVRVGAPIVLLFAIWLVIAPIAGWVVIRQK